MKVAETGDVARLYNVIEDETFVGDVVKVTDTDVAVKWRKTGAVERFPRYIRSSITFSEPVTHHVTRYSNEISCGATGATGPVRVEYTARKVTCPDCKAAANAGTLASLSECRTAVVDQDHEAALKGGLVWDDGTDFTYSDGSDFHATPAPVCWRAGDHWPHMAAVSPDCRILPTDQQ